MASSDRAGRQPAEKAPRPTRTSSRPATKAPQSKAAEAAKAVEKPVRKAAGTVRAARAARSGMVEEARSIAAEADLGDGPAGRAIAAAESMHYQVEVNKRGLSVTALTRTLNERWENGWRLAHLIEQRGNTVLVFERR